MNTVTRMSLVAWLSLVLIACGGGGGESNSASPAPQPSPATPADSGANDTEQTETEAANEAADTTAELLSTPDFDFTGSFELNVKVAPAPTEVCSTT